MQVETIKTEDEEQEVSHEDQIIDALIKSQVLWQNENHQDYCFFKGFIMFQIIIEILCQEEIPPAPAPTPQYPSEKWVAREVQIFKK